ncbi:phage portal protein [Thermoanaerobacter thermocopriae]|uniref:phage portal protein n=1 Tax=Thermoanaerobacter thermocopriae TaxID=29350 RepID=UPI000A6DDF6D|nr:phage portal protein [Thermoanaerobacter thermocopriae]
MMTDLSFCDIGAKWPPDSEMERLQRYDQNRKLFEGRHELVFKDWVRLLRDDKKATLEIILNWPKRLSTLWADLLLGEPPRITAGETGSKEQEQLDKIIKNNNFLNTAYEVAIDLSRYGDGIFKTRYDKKAIIEAIPPALWFPVVNADNIKDVQAHIIAWTFDIPTPTLLNKDKKTTYLRLEIHERGKITNRLFELQDGIIKNEIDIKTFYPDLEPEIYTGIDDFLVVPVHNMQTSDRIYGLDDYSDLDSIIQEIEVRIAQISRILDKHADPNMYGPATALEQNELGEWVVRGGGNISCRTRRTTTGLCGVGWEA